MALFAPSFIPLWVALLAGVISLLGLIISKENRVSEFRQEWIDALRAEIASLIGRAYDLNRARVSPSKRPGRPHESDRTDFLHMELALAQIDLLLNPDDEYAKSIFRKAKAIVDELSPGGPVGEEQLTGLVNELRNESKRYLKKEWEVVKKGEPVFQASKYLAFILVSAVIIALFWGIAHTKRSDDHASETSSQVSVSATSSNVTILIDTDQIPDPPPNEIQQGGNVGEP